MELLANLGVDGLRTLIWILAIVVVVILAAVHLFVFMTHRGIVQIVTYAFRSLFGGAIAFTVTSVGVIFYILAHATDPRWSVGRDSAVTPPQLSSNVPLFDGIVNTLNSFTGSMAHGVNDVLAIKNAFLVAGEFMSLVVWGLLATIILGICTFVMGHVLEAWRTRQIDQLVASEASTRADLAQLRQQLGLPQNASKKTK